MNAINKIFQISILAVFSLMVLILFTDTAYAEVQYELNEETGVMTVYSSVPDGDKGGWYGLPEKGVVKEVVFAETEEPITIGKNGFDHDGLLGIKKVTFSSSVVSIGDSAFWSLGSDFKDMEIVFPETGLKEIGDSAFVKTETTVDSLKLPDSLERVGRMAFGRMTIENLQLPAGIQYIGPKAFAQTKYFDDMIGTNYSCMGGALYNKDITSLIQYPYVSPTGEYVAPASLRTIETDAFYKTKYLRAVILPEGFRRIEDDAFGTVLSYDKGDYDVYLTKFYTMVIPTTMEYFGKSNYSGLQYYYYRGKKSERDKIKGADGKLCYSDGTDRFWGFEYDVESISIPDEITVEVGKEKTIKINISPNEAATEGAKACRAFAQDVLRWGGSVLDINDGETRVFEADTVMNEICIKGLHEGTARLTLQGYGRYRECIIHVVPATGNDEPEADISPGTDNTPKTGGITNVGGAEFKILSTSSNTAAFTKAKNKKNVTVPTTIKIDGKRYKVVQINAKAFKGKKIRTISIGKNVKVIKANAFKGSKATKLIIKTKGLKKSKVKGSLKGSKIKTVQVKLGSKALNRKYVKSYKKIFTKANAGRKVTVK